ncbi:hypothetical protein A3B36_02500 [Candidatus Uhrbacteria bacterium RIFCSPLOWO2_01_FULL_55_36]|uniref:Malate dehydrogenase n=1 Tax=Candidatus Uhrbacteria bacterium RIFCSPLOWO2_01_FULL_55_36 TaxID=1802404 RepID=A0A1F7V1I5_9BACT|nr:MAG: hypothetical protein A3B36_02500 [Candidatus Uhrbacteria bacterium RIFCSPLOWO2_01_FULL_55_36]
MQDEKNNLKERALRYHREPSPGKLGVTPTKPCASTDDLSLAYTPGVAYPCLEIKDNPEASYDYTARGHTVAVITDGSAVLGLGNIGAQASMPVMEGKCVLLKKFAGLDGVPIAIKNYRDTDDLIHIIASLEANFGLMNLEDIKAPECFTVLAALQQQLSIPVFHDDQDGTAVIVLAALENSLALVRKSLHEIHIVINGAGAAGIACARLMVAAGIPKQHITLVDRTGVVSAARNDLNEFKREFAREAELQTLADALHNADVFLGVSCPHILNEAFIHSMNRDPIVFALANPDPEVLPDDAKQWGAAIVATGRSDYPNQVNNVLGFPGIFHGTLDTRAKIINTEMKLAAARALSAIAKKDLSPAHIVPSPFDPSVVPAVARAVAEAAIKTGVAHKPIHNFDEYEHSLMNTFS